MCCFSVCLSFATFAEVFIYSTVQIRFGDRKLTYLCYRESLAVFEELSGIFSNENNQIASRNLLMKVGCNTFLALTLIQLLGCAIVRGERYLNKNDLSRFEAQDI